MTRLALHSGMRAGEIQTLQRDQIDLDRRLILLTKTKNGSARLVPLTKAATEVARAAPGVANTIIRAPRRTQYLVLNQSIATDGRLSWAARGMLAYLLSRPDNWEVRIKDLQQRGNLGRDGTYQLIKELRSVGYVEFRRGRDARGRIRGGSYIVREIPNPPRPESPDTDLPELATPDPVDPDALTNTEVNLIPSTTTTTYNTQEQYLDLDQQPCSIMFPDGISPELQRAACREVARFEQAPAQMLIDEWAGAIGAGKIKQSPLGYLHELAARLDRNQFRSCYADDIAELRAKLGQTFR